MSKALECGLRSAIELPIGKVQEENLIFENLILKKITMESQGLQQTKQPQMICVSLAVCQSWSGTNHLLMQEDSKEPNTA